MKCNPSAFLILLVMAIGLGCSPACAQVSIGAPIGVKARNTKPPKVKVDTFKGEVLHVDMNSIVVRDAKNTAIVRTFTFTPGLSAKMQKLLNRGGYQFGDHVKIKFADGTTVAKSISGKASKPL